MKWIPDANLIIIIIINQIHLVLDSSSRLRCHRLLLPLRVDVQSDRRWLAVGGSPTSDAKKIKNSQQEIRPIVTSCHAT